MSTDLGDEMVSMAMKLVRASPLVPQVGLGNQPFQPLWYENAGQALISCVKNGSAIGQTLEVAGTEVITVHELLDRLSELTDRPARSLPLPSFVDSLRNMGRGHVEPAGTSSAAR